MSARRAFVRSAHPVGLVVLAGTVFAGSRPPMGPAASGVPSFGGPASAAARASESDEGSASSDDAVNDDDTADEGADDDDRSHEDAVARGLEPPSAAWDDLTAASGDALVQGDAGARRRRIQRGGCAGSMVRVRDYCIDRYEAPNRRGAKPLVMQSAIDGAEWCNHHNKRLCTEDEWIGACEGDEKWAYPYGPSHVDAACTDDKPMRTVDEATLAKWPAPEAHAHARSLYQATPSGWKHKCVSEGGAADMTGNVEEWVARTREHANAWPYVLAGCSWSGCYSGGKPTCRSTNDAHGPQFRFYETGFRCCRDAARAK